MLNVSNNFLRDKNIFNFKANLLSDLVIKRQGGILYQQKSQNNNYFKSLDTTEVLTGLNALKAVSFLEKDSSRLLLEGLDKSEEFWTFEIKYNNGQVSKKINIAVSGDKVYLNDESNKYELFLLAREPVLTLFKSLKQSRG